MAERCPYCSFDPTSLSDYCDKHRPEATCADCAAKDAEIERLTALLREGEWEGSCATPRGTLVFVCSRCGRARHEGHAIDCRLKAALTGRGEA